MSYIIMAIQEEGSETRINDLDEDVRGFETREAAYEALNQIRNEERYPEFRSMWVEELKDADYWYERFASEDYDYYPSEYED